ncbi:MAG: GPW/gp25 family protein [Deltaproteobacteria bacterium]|nr:GPW/gp25 family protein [Deltaproteobacteria bacterium]
MADNHSFLGRGWRFPPEFSGVTGGVNMVSEEMDICESLDILLSTRPGERIMNPAFGCRLQTMVFESIDESTAVEIEDIVRRAILFFEPRITVNRIQVSTVDAMNGRIDVAIDYTIRTTNTRSNFVYPFYLREATIAEG